MSVLLQVLDEAELVLNGTKKTRLLLSCIEAVVEDGENLHADKGEVK